MWTGPEWWSAAVGLCWGGSMGGRVVVTRSRGAHRFVPFLGVALSAGNYVLPRAARGGLRWPRRRTRGGRGRGGGRGGVDGWCRGGVGVGGSVGGRLAVGAAEPVVVLGEGGGGVGVRDGELLVDERVGFLEVGVAGVVVDDHLVDAPEAVEMLLA